MTSIYFVANRVPLGPENVHLQIVYGDQEIEVQSGFTWDFKNRLHDGTDNKGNPHTPHVGESDWYDGIAIDIGNRDAAELWQVFISIFDAFKEQMSGDIPYLITAQNSNTFINSVLSIVGIDAASYVSLLNIDPLTVTWVPDDGSTPYDVIYDSIVAPGTGQNILDSPAYSPDFNLTGFSSDDTFITGYGNDTLSGGGGNDTLNGGGGDDQIFGGDGNDLIYGGDGSDVIFGGAGNDIILGGGSPDIIAGDDGDDIILGGMAADQIYGGAGNDTLQGDDPDELRSSDTIFGGDGNDVIIFDEFDVIDGGVGWDVAIYDGFNDGLASTAVNLNATQANVEVVIGGAGDDMLSTDGNVVTYLAGGAGDDTFNVSLSGRSPTIVWGGEGADTIALYANPQMPAAGILVVQASNITENNFQLLDLDMLGLGHNFDWSLIDAVVINPDSSDRITINGQVIGTTTYAPFGAPEVPYTAIGLDSNEVQPIGIAGTTSVSFLGGTHSIFTAISDPIVDIHVEFIDGSGVHFIDVERYPDEDGAWFGDYGRFTLNSITGHTDWVLPNGETLLRRTIGIFFGTAGYGLGFAQDVSAVHNWFMMGGEFSNSSILQNGHVTLTLPDAETFDATGLRGGRYDYAEAASNLTASSEVIRITYFNTTTDTVVINGNAIHGSNLPEDVATHEADGSVVISNADGGHIVLRGVSMADWLSGSQAQLHGTYTSETLTGTAAPNVIAGGGGDDTISAGAGDDRINYASGNDVILGNTQNLGFDTLDLRRFSSQSVTFSINGHDVLITTPDGVIRLDYQVRYEYGHTRSNIETILFADGALDEVGIKDRALSDQSTSGDDYITGTIQADFIFDGAGNDSILAGDGNDVIFHAAGDDVIFGSNVNGINAGFDTLYLSAFSGNEVRFSVQGYDVRIETAAGTVTLDYQIRYEIGHARSNIEAIVFNDLTLDEAGIRARAVADQATSGNDSIQGTGFADTLAGGAGNDTLTGGAGVDVFVFAAGDGQDWITDFSVVSDRLRIAGEAYDNLVLTQVGSAVEIGYGAGDTITLANVSLGQVTQDLFEFV